MFVTFKVFASCAVFDCFNVDSSFVNTSLGNGVADVTVTFNSPLYFATNSLNPSITPSVSVNLPFSDNNANKFFVTSLTASFFAPLPSALAKSAGKPCVRSFWLSVGLETKNLRSGTSVMLFEIAFSSVWTFVSVWGDFASAAA